MRRALLTLGLLALLPRLGHAQSNLLTNGGFETGDFTGWTLSGNGAFRSITTMSHSGSFAWNDGAVGTYSFISQDIATTPGATYTFSFWYAPSSTNPAVRLFASFDGTTLFDQGNNATGWQLYSQDVIATGNVTTVTLGMRDDPYYSQMDDISVVQASTTTPEPATWALMGGGLVTLAGVARQRRRTTA